MVAGCPRTVSPPPEECIKLGEDLVKWVTEPTDEWRCLLGQWWSLKQNLLRSQWNALKQRAEFVPYYERAQQALAAKAANGAMEKSFGHRYIRLYDRELRDDEDSKVDYDESVKAKYKNQDDVKSVDACTMAKNIIQGEYTQK